MKNYLCSQKESAFFGVNADEITGYFNDIQNYDTKLGIYSLSTIFSNELMWSHYSSSHKGFCIEYDIEKLKNGPFDNNYINEIKVDYKDEVPILSLSDINSVNSLELILKKMFATKSLI